MSERFARYCRCGAAVVGTCAGENIALGRGIVAEFDRDHSQAPHGLTDARGASAARAREWRTRSPFPRARPAKGRPRPLESFNGREP